MSKPTAGWDRIGDRYYRKTELYSDVFDPDLELENYLVAGAPFSGALALHRDTSKLHAFRAGDAGRSSIDIYASSGKLIRRLPWDGGFIRGLGWSEDEKLLAVVQDGTVRCYSGLSEDFTTFSLGREAKEEGVVACRFWLTGFVALLGNNQLIAVSRYEEPRPKILATPPSDEINSWSIIPPAYTLSHTVEVLLSINQTINVVDATDSEDRMLQNGPFRHISVSPNGKFIALYTDDGKVWVITSDFQEKLSEYDTKSKTIPRDLQWCGNDAVVLAWEDEVHLLGPNGAASKYFYDAWVHLMPDVDGIRIFTNQSCEFLQKVPDASEDIFKPGSTTPAAALLDAAEHLEKRSPRADDIMQTIKSSLIEAIDTCISAGGQEFTISLQKKLMKAASFGKSCLDLFDPDPFVAMCSTIRVLNSVRFHEIGLPLSYEQYVRLGPERLVQRLIHRQEYVLALRICEYLDLPVDQVFIQWARQKVRVSTDDDDTICKVIVKKVADRRGISYEDIARAAFEEGRAQLATKLLDHEPMAGKQVPLLLDMEEDSIALDKAIESGDSDLVLFVLLQMRSKMPLATFFRTINTRPVATALVEATARGQDNDLLKDLYYQDDRRTDGANLLFADALRQPDTPKTLEKLRMAARLVQDSRDASFEGRAIHEMAELLRVQGALDADATLRPPGSESTPPPYTGLSLNETMFRLIAEGHAKRAAKMQVDFKAPERAFWWIRLRALVQNRYWRELEAVATQHKKSPIGWEPFFNEVLNAGNRELAGRVFVPRCAGLSPRERATMYLKCGMAVKAAEEAAKAKDRELLEELRGTAEGRDLTEVERLISSLGKRR